MVLQQRSCFWHPDPILVVPGGAEAARYLSAPALNCEPTGQTSKNTARFHLCINGLASIPFTYDFYEKDLGGLVRPVRRSPPSACHHVII